ncbi:hypothetical protein OG528_20440 [Streptomyces platensis]|uniref:hypothetical protein n=1 Tax=Streptomyces platensis TaxID=58346 RepID=UPI0030DF4CB4
MADATPETPEVEDSAIPEPATDDLENGTTLPEGNSANREAARYRTKLREAEGKLEVSEARINALLRKEVEAYAAKKLSVGSDLLDLGGVSVSDLLTPEGDVDTETIDAAIEALLAKRPGLSSSPRPWGDVGGGHRSVSDAKPTMLDALRYKGR